MNGIVRYGSNFTSDTGAKPSNSIWKSMPTGLMTDPSKGYYFYKDTIADAAANQAATFSEGVQRYTGATSGSTITHGLVQGGSIIMASTTDNEGCAFAGTPDFKIAAGQGRLWFEARFKMNNITDSKYNVFCGLAEGTAVSATFPLTTSDAMADANFVGFQRLFADGDALDTTYKADTVTQVTVKADAIVTVADTYVKVGMTYKDGVLTFYKDGVALADTKSITTTTGADFPSDVNLAPIIASMAGHGDDVVVTCDWIRCAQEAN